LEEVKVSKFDKYSTGEVKFKVGGEDMLIHWKVRDKVALAMVYDNKDMKGRYDAMVAFSSALLQREYPDEKKEEIENFLAVYLEDFLAQLMIAVGIMKPEDLAAFRADAVKKGLPPQ